MTDGKTSSGPPEKRTFSVKTQIQQMAAGAISSALSRFFCQPFEVLKIRFQLQMEPLKGGSLSSKYTSIPQACRLIYKEEGIKAFWKGHNAGQMLSLFYGVSQFWAYEQIYLDLSQRDFFRERPNWNRFTSGGLSGTLATLISMPFDVIRTRLVGQDTGSGYHNATRAIPRIFRDEGMRGLYRGLGPSLIQIVPLVGSNFVLYEVFNDVAMTVWGVNSKRKLPTWYLLFSGAASGAAAKVITYPLDFIKRRLQLQGFQQHRKTYGASMTCNGFWHCIHLTLQQEGLLGFYKGMAPTLLKSAVTTAFFFGAYDAAKHVIIAMTGK